MAQPVDYDYIDWLTNSDTTGLFSEGNSLLMVALQFASSMGVPWGGWLGYVNPDIQSTTNVGQFEADRDESESSLMKKDPIPTSTGNQDCARTEGQGNWGSEGTRSDKYPWYLLRIDSKLMGGIDYSYNGNAWRIDICENKNYRKGNKGEKIGTRRFVINTQFNNAMSDTCFSVVIYRFIKTEMGRYIRNYIDNIHPDDRDLPQPELLLYLYEYLSYLTNIKSERTLDYLYSRVPEIFYPYRNAFKVDVKKQKQYGGAGCGKNDDSLVSYDLQLSFGINSEFPNDANTATWNEDYPGDISDFSPFYQYGYEGTNGHEPTGREWWHEQFKKRLPDSFLTMDSLGYNLRYSLGVKLEEHLEEYAYIYENAKYDWRNPITDRVDPHWKGQEAGQSGPPTERVPSSEVLDWWEEVLGTIYDYGTANQKNERALEEEKGDIENLDFTLCGPIPISMGPSSECGCIPDPNAIVPDWTEKTGKEPFLNEKTCEYSITMLTPHERVGGGDSLSFMMADQIKPGVKKLLKFYGKDSSEETVNSLLSKATAADSYVPTRARLKIKALITIPAKVLDAVISAKDAANARDDADKAADASAPFEVTLKGEDIRRLFRQSGAAMRRWGIKYQTALWVGKTQSYPSLYWANCDGSLKRGLSNYKTNLIRFLRKNKFRIVPLRKKISKLEKVTLKFSDTYELLSIEANAFGCPTENITEGFDAFKQTNPINDVIISRMVSQLPEIVDKITAREPIKWKDFLKTYLGLDEPGIPDGIDFQPETQGPGNCNVGNVLAGIGKPFIAAGSQAFGQILTFPQLVTSQFGVQVCYSLEKKKKKEQELDDPKLQLQRQKEQWARELNAGDSIFNDMGSILEEIDNLDEFFSEFVNKIGVCGNAALLMAAIDCLMQGLGVEVGIKSFLIAQIKNFSDKQMEGLFFQLNPGLQDLLKTAVDEITSIPLPWEAGYRPGSYNGAGVSFTKQIKQKHKEVYAAAGIEVGARGPQADEVKELVWPEECLEGRWFRPKGDPYEYMWVDYDTLKFYRDRKEAIPEEQKEYGTVILEDVGANHGVFDCRPVWIVVQKPLKGDKKEELKEEAE